MAHYLLDKGGGDNLAGTAPGGEAVEQDNLVALKSLLPLLHATREILSWLYPTGMYICF